MEPLSTLSTDPIRLACAICMLALYLIGCFAVWKRHHPGKASPAPHTGTDTPHILILYASQTGQAEALAQHTDATLNAAGHLTRLARLDEDWAPDLQRASSLLIIASTYGEGEAPDHARAFSQRLDSALPTGVRGLPYAVLALGDRNYSAFCAFGHRLDQALEQAGARRAFAVVEVDRLAPEALARWARQLAGLTGTPELERAPAIPGEAFVPWRWLERQHLNPGSPGSPMYRIRLQPAHGAMPDWRAGDLVDLIVPDSDGRPRSYSIANLPGDGFLELIVRSRIRPDGSLGEASGWLNQHARAGDELPLRLRSNPGFHLTADIQRPVILIGAGTGIAGLRGHLQARAAASSETPSRSHNTWLIFGERSARTDRPCQAEFDAWHAAGVISRLDLVFSRDEPSEPYVHHRLRREGERLKAWLAEDAVIMICGCAHTMARDLDRTLREIIGDEEVDARLADGRIRRDVF